MGLTPGKALQVAAPIVEESPVSIECRVRQVLELGTHDMFLAEVVAVQVDADYIDPATGRFCLERACPIVYSHGEYFALGEAIGHFGWSVRKKPRPKTQKPKTGTKPEAVAVTESESASDGGQPRIPARQTAGPKTPKRPGLRKSAASSAGRAPGRRAESKKPRR